MKYSSVDFSFSCSAITILESPTIPKTVSFKNCRSYFLTDNKKFVKKIDNVQGIMMEEWSSNEQRFDQIANQILELVNGSVYCFIEGYAFGAKGVVYQIGEACGILQNKLYHASVLFEKFPPTTIKKFFTGSGKAKKPDMYQAFLKSENYDIRKIWEAGKADSPFADVVDSFAILKYGVEKILNQST